MPADSYRPLVIFEGRPSELPSGSVTQVSIRGFNSPTLIDVVENELVIDLDSSDLVIRLGDRLFRYNRSDTIISYPSKLDFTLPKSSAYFGFLMR
jgi:hypothetical protein